MTRHEAGEPDLDVAGQVVPGPAAPEDEVAAVLQQAHRDSWGQVMAAAVRVVRDLDAAEDCAQEAYAAALTAWPRDGLPDSPTAWLITAARRRGVDVVRREVTLRSKLPLLVVPGEDVDDGPEAVVEAMVGAVEQGVEQGSVQGAERVAVRRGRAVLGDGDQGGEGDEPVDEQLRLVFLCCHPALAAESQAALTLRLVCGMSTAEIAAAFLVPEATMAARITRAKKKIAVARIPLRMPTPAQLPSRLQGVLEVVHLLFTTGHTAPAGSALVRVDLLEGSLHLVRHLRRLLPDQPEVVGLEALMVLTDARRGARTGDAGALVVLDEQDRASWDHRGIAEARQQLAGVVRAPQAGRYVLQALIALAHVEAASSEATDWVAVLGLYDQLLVVWPTPVVALNRAVAVAQVHGAQAGLVEVEALSAAGRLEGYHYLHAVRGELLARLGRVQEAAGAYRRALQVVDNDVERQHLTARLAEVT